MLLVAVLAALTTRAQSFSSGSDGRDGDLFVTASTNLALPPDGIFRFKKVNIASNAVVTFTTNSLNTPVYILATDDIVVRGTIDVSGGPGEINQTVLTPGGPGGFAGGPSVQVADGPQQSYGLGPAGGGGAQRGAGSAQMSPLLVPLIGGSGGAGVPTWDSALSMVGASGGGGGGAILLASNSGIEINGSILANGGRAAGPNSGVDNRGSGAGAGGAIRLVARRVFGSGKLGAHGGVGYWGGGGGRIRIDSVESVGASLQVVGNGTRPIMTFGKSMVVFPPDLPRLFLVHVAGQSISTNPTSPVVVRLDSPATNRQPVVVGGTGFRGDVTVEIVATPDNGLRYTTNVVLKFGTNTTTVLGTNTLVFPSNRPTQVNAYVRYPVTP